VSDPTIGDRVHAFPGGLKLRHNKQIACRQPIRRPPLPTRLFIPIEPYRGRAAQPLVRIGQQVLGGQPLSIGASDLSVPDHAPTSARVIDITDHPTAFPPGGTRRSIVLEPDGQDRHQAPQPLPDWPECRRDELIDHLHAQGLAGMGGAMFPSAAKLRGDWGPIHTLILNGAECEPWIACDEMLMRERAAAVIEGGLILARAAGATTTVIAIEDRMGQVEDNLRLARAQLGAESRVRIRKVLTIYPEGGERQIIQALTGQEVAHDGLPQDLGVVVHNVATAAAARDAVIDGRALTERIVTVTGPGIAEPCNLLALIGTPLAHLVRAAGGYQGQVTRLILGGPMSGTALADDRIAVTKGSNCLLALTEHETQRSQPILPCINCGFCVRVCPASLLPQTLFRLVEAGDYQQAADHHLADCIDCGCCAQVCPSHIPLVDYYRHGKDELVRQRLDQRRAALARRRYEARQARLADEQAERQARREAREEKLKRADQAKNEIQAAIERARAKRDPDAS